MKDRPRCGVDLASGGDTTVVTAFDAENRVTGWAVIPPRSNEELVLGICSVMAARAPMANDRLSERAEE